MPRRTLAVVIRFATGILAFAAVPLAEPANTPGALLDQQFTHVVRPFVQDYCVACHSGATPPAGFDLSAYTSMDMVIRDLPHWSVVIDKLTSKQMPPAPMPVPSDAARQKIVDWIKSLRMEESRKNAGDPGPVLARRLSNSEYNYTIRDLTGVDIQPTKEFPVDPANQAGFDNSGESLTMSPALLKKYLQAAHDVADHMVLTPDGMAFAPTPMLVETDKDKYTIERIVNFYFSQPTDFADYFAAAWRYKYRAALGKPGETLAKVAADSKLSLKYLPLVWQLLEEPSAAEKKEVGPVKKLQTMWNALPGPAANKAEPARQKFTAMRDFVKRIRLDTGMQFAAPIVKGLPGASEALMDWKLDEFAAHHRDSDPKALRNDEDPPPVVGAIPRYPGLHQDGAAHWAALINKSRAEDPDLVVPRAQRALYQASFERFARVFPDQFFVSERGRYFPDESQDKGRLLSAGYHNVMGYYRDDTALRELILDDKSAQELDKLWDEFDFIAAWTERTWVQFYFNQSGEVLGKGEEGGSPRPVDHAVTDTAVIDGLRDLYISKAEGSSPANDPVAPRAVREHFDRVNATLRRLEKMHADAEPKHLDALLKFAARAYRRPLTKAESDDTLAYYHELRNKGGLSHEDAMRDSIVAILMSPDFLYRLDLSAVNRGESSHAGARPVAMKLPAAASSTGVQLSGYALANRLSYFLWSSMPDKELLDHAASGDLQNPAVLLAQTRRMLKDDRSRDFATEFGGDWLEFRRFETWNGVDRQRFPEFTSDLREAMFQEPVRFIQDVIQHDRSVLDMLYGKYTFVNRVLAKFYGMPVFPDPAPAPAPAPAAAPRGPGRGVLPPQEDPTPPAKPEPDVWVRVDNADQYQRGGLLPMAVFLSVNSPGLRTSPVKRGHWLVSKVLGEVIPPPPPVVPQLPNDEAKSDLPIRELLTQHRANPMCASCHQRFDVFGLALEGYGPVGETRTKDLAGRVIDASATLPGGVNEVGLQGVEQYIRDRRQKGFVDGLARKLVSYALDRSLLLSDEPLIDAMQAKLVANGYRFDSMVETIVLSPQFRNRRSSGVTESTVAPTKASRAKTGIEKMAAAKKGM